MQKKPKAIVIGSGLSGMTAAMDLCDAGYHVQVLEKNHMVGGRTSSWNERGMHIESGLHRYLGIYELLPTLLKRAGIDINDLICWEDEIEIRLPDGAQAVMGAAPFHKPLKTAKAALDHGSFYSMTDKLALARMFAAGLRDYKLRPQALDSLTVDDYARQHGVSARAIDRILKPLTEGIFFLPIEKYSAYSLIGLFAPFIPALHKLQVGAFMGGMSEVMMPPLVRYVVERGGQVSLGAEVERIETVGSRVSAVIADGIRYEADAVVLAASLQGAKSIIATSFPDEPYFDNLRMLPSMPAVTFQLELTEPSMGLDRTTFGPNTVLASFAEQSRTTFRASPGRLSVILADPETYIHVPEQDILQSVLIDAERLGLDLRGKVKDYRTVYLPDDFYHLGPGSEALRPHQRTPIGGLALAGDYTKQKYLATMEGAVAAGHLASRAILTS